jgi:hypothetical protein
MTPSKEAIFSAGEPRDATGHVVKATPTSLNVNEANRNLETTSDTILANRRRASQCIEKIVNISEMSLGIHATL